MLFFDLLQIRVTTSNYLGEKFIAVSMEGEMSSNLEKRVIFT